MTSTLPLFRWAIPLAAAGLAGLAALSLAGPASTPHAYRTTAIAPAAASGDASCADSILDGTLLTVRGDKAFTVAFRSGVARVDGAPAYTVLNAACSATAISFSLAGPDGTEGACLLGVTGSSAGGDCRLPESGEAGFTAILDRSAPVSRAPEVAAHGS